VTLNTISNVMIGVCDVKQLMNLKNGGGAYSSCGYMYFVGSHQCYHMSAVTAPGAAAKKPKKGKIVPMNKGGFAQAAMHFGGKGTFAQAAPQLNVGDRVGVILDLTKHTVEFTVKGKSLGVCYRVMCYRHDYDTAHLYAEHSKRFLQILC